jgi:hypothetical protein
LHCVFQGKRYRPLHPSRSLEVRRRLIGVSGGTSRRVLRCIESSGEENHSREPETSHAFFDLTCLLVAGGAAAQTAPGFPELFDQASNTYEKGDWAHCHEQFAAAAKAALKFFRRTRGDCEER